MISLSNPRANRASVSDGDTDTILVGAFSNVKDSPVASVTVSGY